MASERYLLTRMRHVELNPVRVGLGTDLGDYHWSSYCSQGGYSAMHWLAEPEEYRRHGASSDARTLAYRALFNPPLAASDLEAVRAHWNKDCALGSGKFREKIEAMAGRRDKIVPQGRPGKVKGGAEK